ncbi:MAG: V-type ATP synthase subunit I [Methanomassiliicoccales archaeon]|nr:V-type ATP synthase subunit I [Methanomassiliicoccales archaeon]
MLLPEQMTKVLIIGSKDHLEETVNILYGLHTVHLVDFPPDVEGFTLGSPLSAASEASGKLLKLRAVEKDLEIKEPKTPEPIPAERVKNEIDRAIASFETEISDVVGSKTKIQQRLGELEQKKRDLQPFTALPLDLEMYRDYKSITVFVGSVRSSPEGVLRESLDQFELFADDEERFVALFVPRADAEEAQRILVQHGFSEINLPPGVGRPEKTLEEVDGEEAILRKGFEEVQGKLEKLRDRHSAFVLASEEELSITVEKAETPLRTGATTHSFVIDAWVPSKGLEVLKNEISTKMGEGVYIELLEVKDRKDTDEGEEANVEEIPTKASNPRPSNLFEYLVELISTPRYNEIDPASVISIFFPIFFGLMVGDVGYGIPFIILGYLGLKKCTSNEWRTIATALFFGGIFTVIFGVFLFGEALGMHFAPSAYGEITWSSLLGIELPHSIDLGVFSIPIGVFSKLHDVKILLYISIWIGIVHLFVGFALGFANVAMRRGLKHALFEKFGWILILAGGVFLLVLMIDVLILLKPMAMTDLRLLAGTGLLVAGMAICLKGEGARVMLELPGLMSNVISYTRLTAIGMSKAGLALAFNSISIEMIAPGGGIMIALAILVFIVGHLMIFILAIISAGLHGIRLQYVEFFMKFFEGGGLKFNPLKISRKYTTEV